MVSVEKHAAVNDMLDGEMLRVRQLTADDLTDLRALLEANESFFEKAGAGLGVFNGLYEQVEQELTNAMPSANMRLGAWVSRRLIAYGSLVPSGERSVEASAMVDKAFTGRGVVGELMMPSVQELNGRGIDVVAVVKPNNSRVIRALGKHGFIQINDDEDRHLRFVSEAYTYESSLQKLRDLGM